LKLAVRQQRGREWGWSAQPTHCYSEERPERRCSQRNQTGLLTMPESIHDHRQKSDACYQQTDGARFKSADENVTPIQRSDEPGERTRMIRCRTCHEFLDADPINWFRR